MHEDLEWILEDSEDPAVTHQVREGDICQIPFACRPSNAANAVNRPCHLMLPKLAQKTVDLQKSSSEKDSYSRS